MFPIASKSFVSKTIWFSLIMQLITSIIPLHALFIKLPDEHQILTDILSIETVVQFVEMVFYIWIAYAVINVDVMASRRYIDWVITTPIMLLSTIMFMKYQENQEREENTKNPEKSKSETLPLETFDFLSKNKNLIISIFGYNLGMLFFGYLGETNVVPKYLSISVGFAFFFKVFHIIYSNFARYSVLGKQLFAFLLSVWSMYGIAAMFPANLKNVSYNLLDIVAKNFYGLYIYYKILDVSNSIQL